MAIHSKLFNRFYIRWHQIVKSDDTVCRYQCQSEAR